MGRTAPPAGECNRSTAEAGAQRLVADELVAAMEAIGVRAAFGITGGAFGTIFDRMSQSKLIKVYHAQQETTAVYAAMGRAMAALGKELPVCFSTGGPGSTNLLTGVAAAYCEAVPLMVLTGNSSSRLQNRGALHDSYPGGVDILKMFEPITVGNARVTRADEVVPLFRRFAQLSMHLRKPVHLNIPLDVSNLPSSPSLDIANPPTWPSLEAGEVAALERFLASRRPLIFAGNGVKLSGQAPTLDLVARSHRIPVIVTTHGRGSVPEDSSCFVGTFGFASDGSGREFLSSYEPDAILFLGTGLGELSSGGWSDLLGRAEYRVHVDIDASKFNRTYEANVVIQNDLGRVLEQLGMFAVRRTTFPPTPRSSMVVPKGVVHSEAALVHPGQVFKDVCKVLPDDGVLFADLGNAFAWAFRDAHLRGSQQLFVPAGLASMGSGLGAALGAATWWESRNVVCVSGDCATLMCGNELKTAVEYEIPLTLVVLNDRGHGMVHHGSRLIGLEATEVRFKRRVDFKTYAEALGLRAQRVETTKDWRQFLESSSLFGTGPFLLDVWVDETVVPPIADRATVVGDARARRSNTA
jgi:acetolactate synthase I/II/III large subunit